MTLSSSGRRLSPGHPHRQENRREVDPERAPSNLTSPVPQKAPAYLDPSREFHERGTAVCSVSSNDPKPLSSTRQRRRRSTPVMISDPVPSSDLNDAHKCAPKVSSERLSWKKAVPCRVLASTRSATCPGDGVTRSARRWYGECMMFSAACRDAKHRKDIPCSQCPTRRD